MFTRPIYLSVAIYLLVYTLVPPPHAIAWLQAKWIADAVTHSLYHSILAVKCVPFLPAEPKSR